MGNVHTMAYKKTAIQCSDPYHIVYDKLEFLNKLIKTYNYSLSMMIYNDSINNYNDVLYWYDRIFQLRLQMELIIEYIEKRTVLKYCWETHKFNNKNN